jgi:hypothetical protein
LDSDQSDFVSEEWLGALYSVPSAIASSIDGSTFLITNHHLCLVQSASAAVLSISDSYSVNPVSLIKSNFPPLANTILGMSELVWSLEGKVWKVV